MAWANSNPTHVPTKLRNRILNRDSHTCQQCGAQNTPLEVDHRKSLKSGGDHSPENLQALCVPCHKVKTQQEATLWRSKVKRAPRTPIGLK
ncbi:HNH endonuclease [Corynebacterium lizhenjunii]|uniref:HNH endonuclease n=1 Tax=Corynebacterium lizhenjunii TaxID=2709394 RepID=UPI0013EB625A